jgi:hypothetical protein
VINDVRLAAVQLHFANHGSTRRIKGLLSSAISSASIHAITFFNEQLVETHGGWIEQRR